MSDLISRKEAIEAIDAVFPVDPMKSEYAQGIACGAALAKTYVEQLPSAQPETHEERTETHACDCINRKDAIDAHYEYCNKHPDAGFPVWSLKILEDLPSAQPERTEYIPDTKAVPSKRDCVDLAERVTATFYDQEHEEWTQKSVTIADVLDSVCDEYTILPSAQPEHTNSWYINSWCIDCKEYDKENKCCPRYNRVIKQTLDDAYRHGETEAEARFHAQQRWIPCSERLPEKDGDYLTTLTDKDGNYVDVTEWQNIFGGRWIAPLDECDYCEIGNVVAWMPLPEPYAERRTNGTEQS